MKNFLFLAIILLSCSQQDSTKNTGEKIAKKDDFQLAMESNPKEDSEQLIDQVKKRTESIEKYRET